MKIQHSYYTVTQKHEIEVLDFDGAVLVEVAIPRFDGCSEYAHDLHGEAERIYYYLKRIYHAEASK